MGLKEIAMLTAAIGTLGLATEPDVAFAQEREEITRNERLALHGDGLLSVTLKNEGAGEVVGGAGGLVELRRENVPSEFPGESDLYLRFQPTVTKILRPGEEGEENLNGINLRLEGGFRVFPDGRDAICLGGGVYGELDTVFENNGFIQTTPEVGVFAGFGVGDGAFNVVGDFSIINPHKQVDFKGGINIEFGAAYRYFQHKHAQSAKN